MNADQMTSQQAQPEVLFNTLMAAAAGIFGQRPAPYTTGLTFAYYGGILAVDGVLTTIANGTVSLTGSATNYVEATRAGVVSANTSGFTAGRIPLFTVVTSSTTQNAPTDFRTYQLAPWGGSILAKTWPSDANYTLTVAEARAEIISLSGGSLSTTRDLVVPLYGKWIVVNGTSGGQSIQVIGASGTGITIATAKTATVYGDGTNILRATADV